jgi:hypothetical protein
MTSPCRRYCCSSPPSRSPSPTASLPPAAGSTTRTGSPRSPGAPGQHILSVPSIRPAPLAGRAVRARVTCLPICVCDSAKLVCLFVCARRAFLYSGFLSHAECDHLVKLVSRCSSRGCLRIRSGQCRWHMPLFCEL